jgi:hypothetical protein
MTKKHFIALADAIREHNRIADPEGYTTTPEFTRGHIEILANFCAGQNRNFNADRWLGYIAGTNGKNGGAIKA